jgi:hypothetical protein
MTATSPISISPDVLQRAERNARTLGLSVSEYLSRLVVQDTPAKPVGEPADAPDVWGPVPQAIAAQWAQEIAEFEAADKKQPQPRFTSGRELVDYLRQHS